MQPQNSENNKEDSSSQIVSEQVYGFETQNKFQSSISNNPPSIEPPLQKKKRNKYPKMSLRPRNELCFWKALPEKVSQEVSKSGSKSVRNE